MEILVVGYGNTLRRDDGLGPVIVEHIAELRLPNVRCVIRHQLAPELAEAVSAAGAVIFVDAAADGKLELKEVGANPGAEVLTHATDPGAILALAQALYHRAPAAWTLQVPAENFELGEELSAAGRAQIDPALEKIRTLIEKLEPQTK